MGQFKMVYVFINNTDQLLHVADAETSLSLKLAELLDRARHNWTVKPEQLRMLKRGRIDVLVTEDRKPHVILEAKIGHKVKEDIPKRFKDLFTDGSGHPRLVFEVKYDESLINLGPDGLAGSTLDYCAHFSTEVRFPQSGWLKGSVHDLAIDVQHARASIKETSMESGFNDTILAVAGMGCLSQSWVMA